VVTLPGQRCLCFGKTALQRLGFNLLLDGREIGASHGLDAKGMMTPDALRTVGIAKYQELWCTNSRVGKVVEKAEEGEFTWRK